MAFAYRSVRFEIVSMNKASSLPALSTQAMPSFFCICSRETPLVSG
jgi:hypothetical protein